MIRTFFSGMFQSRSDVVWFIVELLMVILTLNMAEMLLTLLFTHSCHCPG